MATAEVTVIIPTTAEERRRVQLERAIASAGQGAGAASRVLVVINGPRCSPALVSALKARTDIDHLQLPEAGLPQAIRAGRAAVRTPFFSFLDDDDEYLDDALATRLAPLHADPGLGFVVTAGWRRTPQGDAPMLALPGAAIEADPLGTLVADNWLASCGGTFRSSAVPPADFAAMPTYLEWTWLALRLAARLRLRVLDTPTYRIHDMAGSLSKSPAYTYGTVPALEAILELGLPARINRRLRYKLGSAHHACSTLALEQGQLKPAWHHHLRSLALPGRLRYLSYTRHLLRR